MKNISVKYYKSEGLKAVLKITDNTCLIASYENEFIQNLPPIDFFKHADLKKYPRQGLSEISEEQFEKELAMVKEKLKAQQDLKYLIFKLESKILTQTKIQKK